MSVSPPQLPGSSPVLEEALRRRRLVVASESASWRAAVSLLVGLLALLDANHCFLLGSSTSAPSPHHTAASVLYMVEMVVFAVSITSFLNLTWQYLYPHYTTPLHLTSRQFQLLRLHPDTPGFARSPEKGAVKHPNPFTPLPGSLVTPPTCRSPTTTTTTTPNNTTSSPNTTPVNMSPNSWLSSPNSPATPLSNNTSGNLRRDHYAGCESPLTDEFQLAEYLSDYSAWESSNLSCNLEDSGSVASQSVMFLRGGVGGNRMDWSPQLKKSVYQLSSPPTKAAASTADPAADQAQTEILSQRLGVDPMQLVSWNENIRVWLTQTVLRPLVSEIENLNNSLPKHGVSDSRIGESPLERLRKIALLPQVSLRLPTLSSLLPFLEVSPDQEYLVSRLKELAGTGALSLYRWNSGGNFRGQSWTDKLPTDSELLVHWLAVYLDHSLVASSRVRLADQGRTSLQPFTHQHFFRHGEKPEDKDKDLLAIVQTQARPPHYVVRVGSKQLDVGRGRNNLLHTLLLFLHQVKHEKSGMLGRVNLGLSGLNILWVLD